MPTYSSIIEMDRKVRQVCSDFGIGVPGQAVNYGAMNETEAMQQYAMIVLKECSKFPAPHYVQLVISY